MKAICLGLIFLFFPAFLGHSAHAEETLTYASGIETVRVMIGNNDFAGAEQTLRAMLELFPDNPEVLSLLARVLFWQKKYDESLETYRQVLLIGGNGQIREEMEKVLLARLMDNLDAASAEGETAGSEAVLRSLFEMDREKYAAGYKLGLLYMRQKDFSRAEEMFRELSRLYPGNADVLSLLAQVLFWQKKYDESLETYRQVLLIGGNGQIREEMEKVLLAKTSDRVDLLIAEGRNEEARQMLEKLFSEETLLRETGYKLGMLYIREREYEKAVTVFQKLAALFPDDPDLRALQVEALILNGNVGLASHALEGLADDMRDNLRQSREDLYYRVRRNYLKFSGGQWNLSGRPEDEREISMQISQRIQDRTFVFAADNISRYGSHDTQWRLEMYSKLGEKTPTWGYLSFSYSPDADFLPKTTFGGELYYGTGKLELSAGYTRMNFELEPADIFTAGITGYLPYGLSLNEKLYFVPENQSYTLVSTIYYEPNHLFRGYYSFGFGDASEHIVSIEDLLKFRTLSNRVGAEYRFLASSSIGFELSYEERKTLYNRYGGNIFTRYWW